MTCSSDTKDQFRPAKAVAADANGGRRNSQLDQALALYQARDYDGAETLYRRYLANHPKDLMALNNAALVAKALGRPQVALLRLTKAVRHHPQSAQSHFNLANTLQELGRLEEAIEAYRRALDLKPDYVKAHLNLGNALDLLHRFQEAAEAYLRALAIGGDHAETHCNLGNCYKAQNKFLEALTHYTCAATLEPDRAEFHNNVGTMRYEVRHYPEAIEAFNRVLELEPGHRIASSVLLYIYQISCDWTQTRRLGPMVRAATDAAWAAGERCDEGALENLSRYADPARNLRITRDSAAAFLASPKSAMAPRRGSAGKRRRLRVGYVSADFREHAVAHVMAGVLEWHDRGRFEIFAYSLSEDDGSDWRRRIEQASEHFVDLVPVDDPKAAARIRDDQIDILVDLTLWTRGTRPWIFAMRPAPVQVQYLGFPGTSAMPCYDYAIVDQTVVPPGHRAFWSEALVYMPHCYFVPDASQPISTTGLQRRDWGLPDDAIVFCSFNQGYKIDESVFSAWMQILAQVPGSVLWLAGRSTGTVANLLKEAQRRDVDPGRLIFAGHVDDKAQHLERLGLSDIALDTLAYNGHTTTTDALWAGVPVVSMLGGHFASRVSASMLNAAGLSDLIAADIDDYVRIAVELAQSPAPRMTIKSRILDARRAQPLFDTDQSVRAMETAYDRVFRNHLLGAKPEDIYLGQ